MATSKTAKVQAEIDKVKAKLAEQQARVKELEAKRTELEKTEIVDIVRGMSIPLDIKDGAAPATSGQLGPKSAPAQIKTDKEDETE
jgi:hypothetical protein